MLRFLSKVKTSGIDQVFSPPLTVEKLKYSEELWIKENQKYFQTNPQRTQTSWRRLQDIWKMSRRLTAKPDVVTTSGRRRLIYDVLKMLNVECLEDIWFKTSGLRRLEYIRFTTFWRHLAYDVLKTSDLRHLEDARFAYRFEDVRFMTSSRSLAYDVLKTYVKRRLRSNVVARSIQRWKKLFFLILYCLKYWQNVKCLCLS